MSWSSSSSSTGSSIGMVFSFLLIRFGDERRCMLISATELRWVVAIARHSFIHHFLPAAASVLSFNSPANCSIIHSISLSLGQCQIDGTLSDNSTHSTEQWNCKKISSNISSSSSAEIFQKLSPRAFENKKGKRKNNQVDPERPITSTVHIN